MNDPSVANLIADLASDDGVVRKHSREALVKIGAPAVAALVVVYRDGNRLLQWEAAKALSDIAAPAGVQVLVSALENADEGIRWLGAEGLGAIGAMGLPVLLAALRRTGDGNELSPWMRTGAHRTLKFAGKRNESLRAKVRPLLEALEAKSSAAQIPAAVAELEASLRH